MSDNLKKIEKPTQELSSILEQMGTEQLGEYLKANKDELNFLRKSIRIVAETNKLVNYIIAA